MNFLKITFCFILFSVLFSCSDDENKNTINNKEEPITSQEIFYVSTTGNDANDGKTENTAWKSFGKAAKTLTEGQTALFEKGDYTETKSVSFENSGSKGKPIIVKSRSKHGAKITFISGKEEGRPLVSSPKIKIQNKSYIEINGFYITQPKMSSTNNHKFDGNDIFVYIHGGKFKNKTDLPMVTNCAIIGNKIEKCYEEGIKLYKANNIIVKDNEITNTTHAGIDLVNCEKVTINNNKVYETGRIGIMVKGGARNLKIYNNIVHNKKKTMKNGSYGMTIGGITHPDYTYDKSGYEAYNVVLWNNIIIGKESKEETSHIEKGIAFYGAKDCHAYNNVIIGTKYGFLFKKSSNKKYGWSWDPIVENPSIKNNILMDISIAATGYSYTPKNINASHNLFYKVKVVNLPKENLDETNINLKNPLFYDAYNEDCRLKNNSPAIGKGMQLPNNFTGFERDNFNIDFNTFDNTKREKDWNMGAY